jgi:hypothetical protein
MRTSSYVCIPMLFKSRNCIQIRSSCKMLMLFLNQYFMFFLMLHLFFCKSNNMYKKMDKAIHGNCAYTQSAFSAYRSQIRGKNKFTIRKSGNFWSRDNIKMLNLICIYTRFLLLKDMGIHMNRHAYTIRVPHICTHKL